MSAPAPAPFRSPSRPAVACAAALLALGCRPSPAAAPAVQIAVASNLDGVFAELAPLFERDTGLALRVSLGSSELFAHQLRQGAPFDAFVAADAAPVDRVVDAGVCDGATRAVLGRGRLALVTRRGLAPATRLADLADPRFTRVALAHPEHAPFGRAAREALAAAALEAPLQGRLVVVENVRQALQHLDAGNVDAAFVAEALVRQRSPAGAPGVLVLDETLHAPLLQTLVICRGGANAAGARRLGELLRSPAGRAVLARHGLGQP